MRSEWFEEFIETFGEATTTANATEEQIERCRGMLPDGLLDVWSQEGFSGYADGDPELAVDAEFSMSEKSQFDSPTVRSLDI